MAFLSYLISGLSLGSVYAIIALGYSMVYGIAKMLNFAHGDIIMIGAYAAFFMLSAGLGTLPAILFSVVICLVLGVLIERLAYKPLRQASSLSVLITAIGVSYFLENAAQLAWGSDSKFFPQTAMPEGGITIGSLTISWLSIITLVSCIVIMLVLSWFINNTNTGRAMRACAEDKGAATLMGINVDRIISITFAIGSGLAAIAAILLASTYPVIYPTMGSMPGIKAFTAAVLGGIGSIPGAFVGGLLLGVIENLSKAYISQQLSDAIVFGVLIVILLIKPAGLLGRKTNEKV
ncbi:MAG: branched-chain amino acid ABC transporter permease [Bulleidia sp.]|nr:branched-chain amino acid ABC transporter permease [Bulleidia sp.]